MNNRILYFILIFIAFSCDDSPTNTEIAPSEELVNNDSLDSIKDTLVDIQSTIIDTISSINEISNSNHSLKIKLSYIEKKLKVTKVDTLLHFQDNNSWPYIEMYLEFTCNNKFILTETDRSSYYNPIIRLVNKADSSDIMSISFDEYNYDDDPLNPLNKEDYISFIESSFGELGMDEWTEGPLNLKEFRHNTFLAYIYNAIYYCEGCDQPVVYDKWEPRGTLIDSLGPYYEFLHIDDYDLNTVIRLENISDLYNNLSYLSNIKFIFKNNTIYFDPEYGFSDSFIPTKPATSNTGFEDYLKTNYELTKHTIIDSAYGEFICTEEFIYSNGITYHYKCGLEGKNDRTTISFPKTELEPLKKLIETLYDEPDNYWETPFNYVPEDIGCWYIINNEVKDSTIVSITCGC